MTSDQSTISIKEINSIALPAILAGIAEPLLSIVDSAFVGNLDQWATESLAAVGLVGVFLSMLVWILGQTRSAISTLVSQYLGAGKLDELNSLPAQAIYGVVGLAFILIVITYPLAPYIFKLYHADSHILEFSLVYFRIRIFGLPFTLLTFAIFGTFRGLQNTYYPMIIALAGAAMNVFLDYILIYGIPNIIPAFYIRGAAYASTISQILMAILAVIFLYKKTPFKLKLQNSIHPEMHKLVSMVLHLFVRTLALNIALYFGSSYATKYGAESIAAYTISINIWFFFSFLIDGISSAGNILSGKLYGAKKYFLLKVMVQKLLKIGIFIALVLGLTAWVFYQKIGTVFIKDRGVLQLFYSVFWLVLVMQPINSIAFIYDGVFKGLGLMKYLRNTLLIATFLGFVPVILISDYYWHNLTGIWIAFLSWMLIRASVLGIKFYKLPFIASIKKDQTTSSF